MYSLESRRQKFSVICGFWLYLFYLSYFPVFFCCIQRSTWGTIDARPPQTTEAQPSSSILRTRRPLKSESWSFAISIFVFHWSVIRKIRCCIIDLSDRKVVSQSDIKISIFFSNSHKQVRPSIHSYTKTVTFRYQFAI